MFVGSPVEEDPKEVSDCEWACVHSGGEGEGGGVLVGSPAEVSDCMGVRVCVHGCGWFGRFVFVGSSMEEDPKKVGSVIALYMLSTIPM